MRDVIDIGPQIPRWRSRALYALGWLVLRAGGWRVNARIPDAPKYLLIFAPHTSNWDFVFGMAAALVVQVRVEFIGKHTLFEGPLGWLFRALGGQPVNRSIHGGIVQQTIDNFRRKERIVFGLAPEGTRALRVPWKRGFYHMALGAQVPIVAAYIDYARKEVGVGPIFRPTGDWAADMRPVFDFYRSVHPRHPENFGIEDL